MPQFRKFNQPTSVDDIIEAALLGIAKNSTVAHPPITYEDGTLARIVKFRNFNGPEIKEAGLTLSIFPYYYEGTSKPTPKSQNASIVYEPYNFTGPDSSRPGTAIDMATIFLKVRLDARGFSVKTKTNTTQTTVASSSIFGVPTSVQVFETNDLERTLRKWTEYIRTILLTDMYDVGGLVKSSTINWVIFSTPDWTKRTDAILHTAEMMWELKYAALRDYRVDGVSRSADKLIGSFQLDGAPIWYIPSHDVIMTGRGQVILTTPSGVPISWDKDPADQTKYTLVHDKTRQPLSDSALQEPTSGQPFIRLDLLPIGVLVSDNYKLVYYNRTTGAIMKYDGGVVDTLPRGKKIAWSQSAGYLVYGPTEGSLAGTHVSTEDLIDPVTGDLYIITTDVALGTSFTTRPEFHEFLTFNP